MAQGLSGFCFSFWGGFRKGSQGLLGFCLKAFGGGLEKAQQSGSGFKAFGDGSYIHKDGLGFRALGFRVKVFGFRGF